jgi:hypothetical protein
VRRSDRVGLDAWVLNVNSPGGFSVGGAEIADAVFEFSKPTVVWVGGMMCSLAYWIGSQAGAVVATRSAGIEVKVFRNKEGTSRLRECPERPLPTNTRRSSLARRNSHSMCSVPMSSAPVTASPMRRCISTA